MVENEKVTVGDETYIVTRNGEGRGLSYSLPAKEGRFAIFDIDGTLSDSKERFAEHAPINGDKVIDWDAFHSHAQDDKFFSKIVAVLWSLKADGYDIIFVTGRNEKFREMTLEKLSDELNYDVDSSDLYMRADGDHRKNSEVKKDLYYEIRDNYNDSYYTAEVYDDDIQCLEAADVVFDEFTWCYLCTEGDMVKTRWED